MIHKQGWQPHSRIYLQPWCAGCEAADHYPGEGRQWCQDDVWGKCEEPGCDAKTEIYVFADPPAETQ